MYLIHLHFTHYINDLRNIKIDIIKKPNQCKVAKHGTLKDRFVTGNSQSSGNFTGCGSFYFPKSSVGVLIKLRMSIFPFILLYEPLLCLLPNLSLIKKNIPIVILAEFKIVWFSLSERARIFLLCHRFSSKRRGITLKDKTSSTRCGLFKRSRTLLV